MQLKDQRAKLANMKRMTIEVVSVHRKGAKTVARARANTAHRDARLWIEITFEPAGEPWADAYDRVLALLDID